jgi:tetratricopeptide (TPR) repeat protein
MRHPLFSAADLFCWVLVISIVGYSAIRAFAHSDDRPALFRRWIISVLLVFCSMGLFRRGWVLLMIGPLVILAAVWIPSWATIILRPLTGVFDGGDEESEDKPFYFTAEGKRRKGLFAEAIQDAREQLEKYPGNYEGYMKIAAIQMENLKDYAAAEATLREFLEIPGHPPNEIVSVYHLLADWQLQHGKGARAASETLQRIVQLYPDTPFAHAALQRIAHLESADEAARFRNESKFVVTPGERNIGLRKGPVSFAPKEITPRERLDDLVRQLEKHPYDTDAREQLATIYAEEFQRVDLAAEQLEQLIALPTEPPKRVAHWLNLLATLQLKCARDIGAAEKALRRIGERFPETALASRGVERLATLNGELKGLASAPTKSMDHYEKYRFVRR